MNLLHEHHVDVKAPTIIFCDNLSAIFMSTNLVSHPRSKHFALDYHFIRERVQSCSITKLPMSSPIACLALTSFSSTPS